jgi:hypothetical protein
LKKAEEGEKKKEWVKMGKEAQDEEEEKEAWERMRRRRTVRLGRNP